MERIARFVFGCAVVAMAVLFAHDYRNFAANDPNPRYFWHVHIWPVVQTLVGKHHPSDAVNDIVSRLGKRVNERYPDGFGIGHRPTGLVSTPSANIVSVLKDDKPYIIFVTRDLEMYRARLIRDMGPRGERVFRSYLLVNFVHQLHHLAHGLDTVPVVREKHAEVEKALWEKTCVDIRPLLEAREIDLGPVQNVQCELW